MVSHRYDPVIGACPNLCCLPESAAETVLDNLRRGCRPTLKHDYLSMRLKTERWLCGAATAALGRALLERPAYFFLGDFSYGEDASRPAALVLPLSMFPRDVITFTLGDSMRVVNEVSPRVYGLDEISAMFSGGAVGEFGLSNREGFQQRIIEMQLWDRGCVRELNTGFRLACVDEVFGSGRVGGKAVSADVG